MVVVGLRKEVRRAGACMEGVEGRDGSRETDTPARDVSVGLCVCEVVALENSSRNCYVYI